MFWWCQKWIKSYLNHHYMPKLKVLPINSFIEMRHLLEVEWIQDLSFMFGLSPFDSCSCIFEPIDDIVDIQWFLSFPWLQGIENGDIFLNLEPWRMIVFCKPRLKFWNLMFGIKAYSHPWFIFKKQIVWWTIFTGSSWNVLWKWLEFFIIFLLQLFNVYLPIFFISVLIYIDVAITG